jgi:hypothetical protein
MKQVNEINIDSEIIPDFGIGELRLGMNSFYIRDFYEKNFQDESGAWSAEYNQKLWKHEVSYPFFGTLELTYNDFINIGINLYSGCISYLNVFGKFEGKINGKVGIGDSARMYFESTPKNTYDFEDGAFFCWIDKRFGLSLFIGEEYDDFPEEEKWEEYLDLPIKSIEIIDNNQRIAVRGELPKKWQKN